MRIAWVFYALVWIVCIVCTVFAVFLGVELNSDELDSLGRRIQNDRIRALERRVRVLEDEIGDVRDPFAEAQ